MFIPVILGTGVFTRSHPPCLPRLLRRETSLGILCSTAAKPRCLWGHPCLTHPGSRGSPLPHNRRLTWVSRGPRGSCRSPPPVLPAAPRGWAGSRRRLLGAAAGRGWAVGRPAPTLRGQWLVPSLGATSAGAAELPPALLPAPGAAAGAACSMPGAGAADTGMPRGCRGSQCPAPAIRTSAQGHQVCSGSRGAHPFPPQLPIPLLAGGTERPGATQGQPTRVAPNNGHGAMPVGWLPAS